MKLRQRLSALASRAVAVFGRNSFGMSLVSLLGGTSIDWSAKAGSRYDNSAVAAAIQYLQGGIDSGPRLIVQKPIKGAKGREWLEIEDHDLTSVIDAGVVMTPAQLYSGTVISLIVAGNAYWLKMRSASGKLVGFAYLAHMRVKAKNDRDFGSRKADGTHQVTYYEISDGDGRPVQVPVEDIVHFRWGIDPAKPVYGLSPVWAALREVVTDNEAATLGANLLQNGGVLGWAISPDKIDNATPDIDPDAMRKTGRILQSYITGDMAGTPAPLPFPIKVTQLGFEPSKLVLDKQRNMAVERILSQIGIDPMVLGMPSQSKTFSNFEEANEAAVRRALLRVLGIIGTDLTTQCLYVDFRQGIPAAGSKPRVSWDLSEVPALQPDMDAQHERGRQDWEANLITRSEWREENGYDVEDARDNVFFADIAPPAPTEPDPDEEEPEEKTAAGRIAHLSGPERLALIRKAADSEKALEALEEMEAAVA